VAGIYNRYAYLPEKRALCHGKPAPDWLAPRLEHTLPLLASRSGDRVVETQAKMIQILTGLAPSLCPRCRDVRRGVFAPASWR
jgi:hypothetical protein